MKFKLVSIIIVLILVIALFVFYPSSSSASNDIKTPFGYWRVELEGNTADGEVIPFSVASWSNSLLTWTYSGNEIVSVTLRIYAKATGAGYDTCDLDLSRFDVTPSLRKPDGGGYMGHTVLGPQEIISIPVEDPITAPVEIMSTTTALSDFEDYSNLAEETYTLVYYCWGLPLKYRGVANGVADPWVTVESSFDLEVSIQITYESDSSEPSCGDGNCENQPYPSENCFTCPNDCGPCNSYIDFINPIEGDFVTLRWDYPHIQYKYWTGYEWTSWKVVAVGDPIKPFYFHNMFALVASAETTGYVRAWCKMYNSEQGEVYLNKYKSYSNSNLDEIVQAGDYCFVYFSTGYAEDHLIRANGPWSVTMKMWIEPTGGQQQYHLTINTDSPTEYIICNNYKVFGPTWEMDLWEGYYSAGIHWADGTATFIHIQLNSDKTILVEKGSSQTEFSMISKNLFTIIDQSESWERYEYENRYLGE